MQSSVFKLFKQSLVISLAIVVLGGVGYVFAAPTQPPSAGTGVYRPLNEGPDGQTKSGALTVGGVFNANAGATISGTLNVSTICLSGDCQSAWPAGGGGVATASGAAYDPAYYCYAFNQYSSLTYYQSGVSYTSTHYHCSPQNFSVTVSSNIPSGKTPGALISGAVWCHSNSGNYYNYTPASSYINDTYYPFRTQGTVSSIVNNNNGTVTINGTCTYSSGQSYSYNYLALRVENLAFSY